MTVRKSLLAAAVAAMAFGSAAWAADQSGQANATSPVYMQTAPVAKPAIMAALDQTSIGKWMDENNISISGFVEGGYFYDTSNPRMGGSSAAPAAAGNGDGPTNVAFPGGFSNRGQLDQLDLMIQKTIDHSKNFDFGFQFENGFGNDDAQIHSNGLLDHRVAPGVFDPGTAEGTDPDSQYDIIQANLSVLLPVGSGLTIKAGKFVTPFGYETINPLGNQFYTHSYLFTNGIPLTQTGVLGSYTFAKAVNGNDLVVTAGATRGWNESLRDNNGAADFLGSMTTSFTDKFGFTVTASEGPEATRDNSNYWTVVEAIPSYQVSDQLKIAADLLYGDFPHGSVTGGTNAQWYDAALYGGYTINSYVTANLRAEIYRDDGGFTNSANEASVQGPVGANYYEATAGVQIHPFPTSDLLQYLQFRPEVRYDFSDRPVFNAAHDSALGGRGDYDQLSVAMDAIMQF